MYSQIKRSPYQLSFRALNGSKKCSVKFKDLRDLSSLLDTNFMTDVILSASGSYFSAHKLILAAATPYFERLFFSDFKKPETIFVLNEVSLPTLQLFIDLIYGREILLTDWKMAFDLFDFFERVLLPWERDLAVTQIYVPPEEYLEYIQRLDRLYNGEIPISVIQATAKFVTSRTNLTGLSKEFLDLIM